MHKRPPIFRFSSRHGFGADRVALALATAEFQTSRSGIVMQSPRPESDTKTETARLVCIVECEDGLFRPLIFPDATIAEGGGIAALEATLCSEYRWHECLGHIPVYSSCDGSISFQERDVDRLVLQCTRRMVRTANICELEYMAMDWPGGPRN
jgi:hypothetical protein